MAKAWECGGCVGVQTLVDNPMHAHGSSVNPLSAAAWESARPQSPASSLRECCCPGTWCATGRTRRETLGTCPTPGRARKGAAPRKTRPAGYLNDTVGTHMPCELTRWARNRSLRAPHSWVLGARMQWSQVHLLARSRDLMLRSSELTKLDLQPINAACAQRPCWHFFWQLRVVLALAGYCISVAITHFSAISYEWCCGSHKWPTN